MSPNLTFLLSLNYLCVFECVFTVTAEQLWRGVLAESGAGARKGRGKRTKRKMRRDLNRGQNLGEGKTASQCLSPSDICLQMFHTF